MSTPGNQQDPYGSQDPYGQQPPYGQASAQENAWQEAPYGQTSGAELSAQPSPYGQPSAQDGTWQQAQVHAAPPQGQYGGAPYGGYAPPQPPPDAGSIQGQAIALIVIGLLCGGMVSSIMGIVALAQMNTDPVSARRLLKIGWILCAVFAAIFLVIIALQFIIPALMLLFVGVAGAGV